MKDFEKKEIYVLKEVLENLKKVKAKPKFHYSVVKNLKVLLPEFETLEEVRKSLQVEGWEDFINEQKELLIKYAEKDEDDKPVMAGKDAVKLAEDTQAEFHEKRKLLDEKYKDTLEKYKENQKEFEEIISEKIELGWWKVDINLIPEDLPYDGDLIELFEKVGILD